MTRTLGLLLVVALALAVAGCSADDMAGGMTEVGGDTEDTTPPTVTITAPVANAELNGETTLQVSATDDGTLAKVEYYADGDLLGTSTEAPWTFAWNTVPPGDGPVTLQAKAFDAANNQAVSQTVPVRIRNGLTFRVTNRTPTSVRVSPSGQSARTIASGASATFTYADNPGSLSYRASARGSHGLTLSWNQSVSTSGALDRAVSLSIGSGYFFLRGRNSSDRATSSLYVNYQASGEKKVKPFVLGNRMTDIGYFRGSGATRIRIYAKFRIGDFGPVYWDFASGISSRIASFTLGGSAAGKQADGGTAMDVHLEPTDAPASTEGTVHYPDSAEEIKR